MIVINFQIKAILKYWKQLISYKPSDSGAKREKRVNIKLRGILDAPFQFWLTLPHGQMPSPSRGCSREHLNGKYLKKQLLERESNRVPVPSGVS